MKLKLGTWEHWTLVGELMSDRKRLGYIPSDGYSERGYVEAAEGFYPALRFTYRPMLQEKRTALLGKLDNLAGGADDVISSEEMAGRVVEWSLVDGDGKPVVVSGDMVRRLKPKLWGRVFNIIIGIEASDTDPQATDDEAAEAAKKAAETGPAEAPGDAAARADAGNSPGG